MVRNEYCIVANTGVLANIWRTGCKKVPGGKKDDAGEL